MKDLTFDQAARMERLSKVLVYHPDFQRALALSTRCIKRARYWKPPPGVLIIGPSGSGKTKVAKLLLELIPARDTVEAAELPLLYVPLPAVPTVRNLAEAIYGRVFEGVSTRGMTEFMLTTEVKRRLPERRVQAIILDEMQQFKAHQPRDLAKASDWLKRFIDDTELPVVMLGLPESEALLDSNEQLRRRFAARSHLSGFGYATEGEKLVFRRFLSAVEKALRFGEPLELASVDLAQRLHWASSGLPGYVMHLLLAAVETALLEDATDLRLGHLERAFTNEIWEFGVDAKNPFNPEFEGRALNLHGEPFYMPRPKPARARRVE